ncbi:hypothetical protein [Paracoccus acridae]
MVTTRRGSGGGAVLALPPETRLGTLVRLLEQKQAPIECFAPGRW